MKSFKLLFGTAVLSLLFLNSCRAGDENSVLPEMPSAAQVDLQTNAATGDQQDPPPKDVPKDYDDWRSKPTDK